MNYGDFAWRTSRLYLSPLTFFLARTRTYGLDRIPKEGGCVLAVNHLHWVDIPIVGANSSRNINFVAKFEVSRVPLAGRFLLWHGVIIVRRGESDRDAVRKMRECAAAGRVIGLFVEGTRQKHGRPGKAMPGAAMVAIQENVPVIPMAVYGTPKWKFGNFALCSLAAGEPVTFEGLPKGGRGYKEATEEIERRINVLFDWLAEMESKGYPKVVEPPI